MAGFKATEAVDELTYDFRPHADVQGTIPEPTTAQIDSYRKAVVAGVQTLGINPESLQSEEGMPSLDAFTTLLDKSGELEEVMLAATADLTGISMDILRTLPYRVCQAFLGWIMGEFFSPEGSTPATR